MQISVQIVVRTEVEEQASVTEIAHFEREGFDAGSLGLHLDEAKALLALPSHTWRHLGGPPSRNLAEILDFA